MDLMDLNKTRHKLSVRGKNGIGFLLSAFVIWSIITMIFLQSIDIQQKNVVTAESKVIKEVNWLFENNINNNDSV